MTRLTLVLLLLGFAKPLFSSAKATPPAYVSTKLSSGLEVITMESTKVPLVTIVLCSKAGAMTETADINGLTHLWEHMFFKGNKRLPNQEAFNRRVRQLGLVYNGDTSAEKVRYYFTMPSALLDDGLQFMADAIKSPLLEKGELEKERVVVLDEYDRNASLPGFKLMRLRRKLLYGASDFLRDPLGVRKIIANANRQQLIDIKNKVFVPSNSAILIAGNFPKTDIVKLVEKHFSDWKDPKGWTKIPNNTFPPFPEKQEIVMTDKEARNVDLQISFPGPKARTQPKDSFAADVLIGLLNNRTGQFYKKFIDSGLSIEAGMSYYTQSQVGETTLYAQSTPENFFKVKKLLMEEPAAWVKPGYFSDDQLQSVRRALLVDYKRQLNKPSEYIMSLAFWWSVTGLDYYDSYLDSLRKVELNDIRQYVQDYILSKNYVLSVLLSPEAAQQIKLVDNSKEVAKKLNLDLGGE